MRNSSRGFDIRNNFEQKNVRRIKRKVTVGRGQAQFRLTNYIFKIFDADLDA